MMEYRPLIKDIHKIKADDTSPTMSSDPKPDPTTISASDTKTPAPIVVSARCSADRDFVINSLILRDLKELADITDDSGVQSAIDLINENFIKYQTTVNVKLKKVRSFKLKRRYAWHIYSKDYINRKKDLNYNSNAYIASKKTDGVEQTPDICRKLRAEFFGNLRKEAGTEWKTVVDEDTIKKYTDIATDLNVRNLEEWHEYYSNQVTPTITDFVKTVDDINDTKKVTPVKLHHLCGLFCHAKINKDTTKKDMRDALISIYNNNNNNNS